MSIESIKARLRRHDRQRMRYGYSDETAPQIWERDLRALLKVAEAARAVYDDTYDCNTRPGCPPCSADICPQMALGEALAALEGRDSE